MKTLGRSLFRQVLSPQREVRVLRSRLCTLEMHERDFSPYTINPTSLLSVEYIRWIFKCYVIVFCEGL